MFEKARLFSVCVLVVLSFAMAGCKTQVCDTRGQSEVCEIHHQFMQTEVVDNKKNWRMPSQEYLEARAHFFRHSYPFVLPEKCKKCAIYVCEDCVRAEEEWKRKHGQ